MGWIDQALKRSNVDAVQGTGAEAPVPAPSPWQVEAQEHRDGQGPEQAADAKPAAAGQAAATGAPKAEGGRTARRRSFDAASTERLVVSTNASALLVEQFRTLAASLHRAQAEHKLKSVIVTSAAPGDGKSYVAVNLALTLAESYHRRVLLIDADLRRPSLHLVFKVHNASGLSEALGAKSDEKLATVQITETLTLVPAGKPERNPLGGLSSGRMKRIVADAASRFDWVIVDSPPVGVLADAHLVSETVDAAILVVRAGMTQYPDLEAAADTMGHDRILGIVLNAVDPEDIRGKGYYHHYYGKELGGG
jgi:capsular exopolysaccharide synthesis family protein